MRVDKRFLPPDAQPRASALLRTFVLKPRTFDELVTVANDVGRHLGRTLDLDEVLEGMIAAHADQCRAEQKAREAEGGAQ